MRKNKVVATSKIFNCDNCVFKSSTERSLEQHIKDKQKGSKNGHKTSKNSSRIPCDACDHIAPDIEAHKKHAEEVHKHKKDRLNLKCSECDYKTVSDESLKKHQQYKHKKTDTKHDNSVEKARDMRQFDELKNPRTQNSQQKSDLRNIPLKRICSYWNRGFCKLSNNECNFLHINLPACRFKDQCFRIDCNFYHEKETQKYPFLGYPKQQTQLHGQNRQNQTYWNVYTHQHQRRHNMSHPYMDKFQPRPMF